MGASWKVIAAFLGVFIAGAVFGGFFSLGMGARWWRDQPAVATAAATAPANPPAAAPANSQKATVVPAQRSNLLQVPQTWQAPMLMRRYAERLELTPEQKERIKPLFQRATEDYRRVQQNTFRETAIILQRLQQDLSQELTSEQRSKLEKMEERQREALQKMEQRQREQKKGSGQRVKAANGTAAPGAAAGTSIMPTPSTSAVPSSPESGSTTTTSGGAVTPTAQASTSGTATTSTPSGQ